MPAKEEQNLDLLSTYEIKRLRECQKNQNELNSLLKKDDLLRELTPLSANDMRKILMNSSSTTDMMANLLKIKAMQNVDSGFLQILQIHGYVKFEEVQLLNTYIGQVLAQHNTSFLNRIVKYLAQTFFMESDYKNIIAWKRVIELRPESEWIRAFQGSILSCPELELQLLCCHILLLPQSATKNSARVLLLFSKKEKELPDCFEWVLKRIFQVVVHSSINKKDLAAVLKKFLEKNYKKLAPLKMKNRNYHVTDIEQKMFLENVLPIAKTAFGIINPADKNATENFLQDPLINMDRPSDVFIEFFMQYVKLGMFFFENGDKMIAWNYYYDDRWCGYDRSDLFGEKFQLSENFRWFEDFKFAGTIKQHPHHENLITCSRVYEWMSADKKLYDTLMQKYQDENFLLYVAVSLSFSGKFAEILEFFEKYRNNITTKYGFMCFHICYMYACAKKGKATECLQAWAGVMEKVEKWRLFGVLEFPKNSFPLPLFVDMKYSGQFASRLLRNCLWTAAMEEKKEGWKKYGMIILHLCDALEDSFLNHNMIRIMFQKVEVEDLPLILKPGLNSCIRHYNTYWSCLQIAVSRGFEEAEKLYDEFPVPLRKPYPSSSKPSFRLVFKKLRQLDEIFYGVMKDIPAEVLTLIDKAKISARTGITPETEEILQTIYAAREEIERPAREEKERLEREERQQKAEVERKKKEKAEKEAEKNARTFESYTGIPTFLEWDAYYSARPMENNGEKAKKPEDSEYSDVHEIQEFHDEEDIDYQSEIDYNESFNSKSKRNSNQEEFGYLTTTFENTFDSFDDMPRKRRRQGEDSFTDMFFD